MYLGFSVIAVFFKLFFLIKNVSCEKRTSGKNLVRTMNVDASVQKWPNKNQILFYLDSNYTTMEIYRIRQAAFNVASNLQGCVTFVETNAADPRYKIYITPNTAQGTPEQFCTANPGMVVASYTSGVTVQRHVMARGQYGCVDSIRQVMKYWTITLGRRNEHERGDRDLYITVNPANLVIQEPYRRYSPREAFWGTRGYDYCSITHNRVTEFAIPGTVAFTFNQGPQATPTLNQLSQVDCILISAAYVCNPQFCGSFDCDAARQAALTATTTTTATSTSTTTASTSTTTPTTSTTTTTTTTSTTTTTPTTTTTTPTTTTTTPTTTTTTTPTTTSTSTSTSTSTTTTTTTVPTCPMSLTAFCNAVPDESSYVLGPFLQPERYVLFSGQCLLEYTLDFATKKLKPTQQKPELISTYFPLPGGATVQPPVTLAFNKLDDPSATGYYLDLQNQGASSNLECRTTSLARARSTNLVSCGQSANSNNIVPTSIATSASSQLSLNSIEIYQYAVTAAQTELKLMNQDFSKTFQQSSGFLNGQTKITKITAIQVQTDLENTDDNFMTVFGTGSDNKPYFGVYKMSALASDQNPITGTWESEPIPLAQAITGC